MDPFKSLYKLNSRKKNKENIIVSLTSFPKRINNVWLVVESILRQTKKPDRIILWLYNGEFESKESLPKKLLNLQRRGLEIRFCNENLKPHKKYFYAVQEFPYSNIITIDDDFIYEKKTIEKLVEFNIKYPDCIGCFLTRKISVKNGNILPYNDWKYEIETTLPEYDYLTMGGSGCFFPPGTLHKEALNKSNIKLHCLTADDIWLKIMSLLQGTKVVGLGGEYKRFFLPIRIENDTRLMDYNIGEDQNSKIFKNLMNVYNVDVKILNR